MNCGYLVRCLLRAAAVRRLLTCLLAGVLFFFRAGFSPMAASRMPPRIPPPSDVPAFAFPLARRVLRTPVFDRISDMAPFTTLPMI